MKTPFGRNAAKVRTLGNHQRKSPSPVIGFQLLHHVLNQQATFPARPHPLSIGRIDDHKTRLNRQISWIQIKKIPFQNLDLIQSSMGTRKPDQ